ncbi:LUD domain-containing protein [Amycolatopsis sp. NPDC047767]|uniref:LutC/YkgG family protein n=1 Tax=Amycolatopsis sp. NPDC047767 TaxID=3156765 RepID=UPI0034569415
MTAREAILAAVRDALRDANRAETTVPRTYRAATAVEFVELFVERVIDYRAALTRCKRAELESSLRAAMGTARKVLLPPGLEVEVIGSNLEATVASDALGNADLASFDAVVTAAALGIATTGTLVLDHGAGQGRRALSLVPDVHVCVVRESQIVSGVPQAVAILDPLKPQTWISGPSATSDIELTRVEGVHGPRTLHVILVAD